MKNNFFILSGMNIHTEDGVLTNAAVVIEKNQIIDIVPQDEIKKYSSAKVIHFPPHFHLVPGFIDMHVHGANGKDVMDASFDALEKISQTLALEGTTAYLATTMTAAPQTIENVLCHVRDYMQRQDEVMGAEILGVHLEGPFISSQKIGAQQEEYILNPDIESVTRWQSLSKQSIKLITLAPELPESLEFIRYLKRHQIIAAIGHTNATYQESIGAIEAGCTHATHLFNAMRGIHQREPGAVTAALLSDQVTAELIVDGVHLHPAIVNMAVKLKGPDNIVLVTDAMRAKCLCDGEYDLGGQAVSVKNNVARLADGTLAGSTLKMSAAIKNLLNYTDCDLSHVIKMASVNPAKTLGIFARKGSIAIDKDADLVVMNDRFDVVMTVCGGRVVSHSNSKITEPSR